MGSSASVRRNGGLKVLLGLIVSVVCLWWAVRGMLSTPGAWQQIVKAFQNANYLSLPAILSILFIFFWLKAFRWRILLLPVGRFHPLKDLFGPIMIGFGFNNILPARIGELIRISTFARQQKLPFTVAASSVVLERIFDGMAIVFYLAIGLLFVEGLDPRIKQGAIGFSIAASCVVVGALCYVIWSKPFVALFEAILQRIPFLPPKLTHGFCRILEQGAQGLSALRDVRLVMSIIVISMAKWALNGALVLLSLWSFDLPHTIPIAMVLLGAIAFGVALPSSPGYIGVMQVVFMEVMKFFTDNSEAVFAASIYYQFTQWVPVTLSGMIFFVLSGISLKQVEATIPEELLQDDNPPTAQV